MLIWVVGWWFGWEDSGLEDRFDEWVMGCLCMNRDGSSLGGWVVDWEVDLI